MNNTSAPTLEAIKIVCIIEQHISSNINGGYQNCLHGNVSLGRSPRKVVCGVPELYALSSAHRLREVQGELETVLGLTAHLVICFKLKKEALAIFIHVSQTIIHSHACVGIGLLRWILWRVVLANAQQALTNLMELVLRTITSRRIYLLVVCLSSDVGA